MFAFVFHLMLLMQYVDACTSNITPKNNRMNVWKYNNGGIVLPQEGTNRFTISCWDFYDPNGCPCGSCSLDLDDPCNNGNPSYSAIYDPST